jgi:hypothetical protein
MWVGSMLQLLVGMKFWGFGFTRVLGYIIRSGSFPVYGFPQHSGCYARNVALIYFAILEVATTLVSLWAG